MEVRERGQEEKDPELLSASQIDVWYECRRKWAFKYIEGLRPEAGKGAKLGTLVHKLLETYATTGQVPDFVENKEAAEVALTMIPHLPAPCNEAHEKEGHFKLEGKEAKYQGYIDLFVPESTPEVWDHKTTANIKEYAKTAEDLLTDTQGVIYAKYALSRFPNSKGATLSWTFGQTRGTKKAHPVRLTVLRDHVESEFNRIELDAKEIIATLQRRPSPLELPPTESACSKYGGCPFRSRCNLGPQGLFKAMSEVKQDKTIDLFAMLDNKPADAPPPAVTNDQPVNPPEATLPPPVETKPAEEKVKKTRAKKAKAEEITTVADATPEESPALPADPPAADPLPEPVTPPNPAPSKYTLFINCMPIGVGSMWVTNLIARANEEIKAFGEDGKPVVDYRLIKYGAGAGMLSYRVAQLAASGEYGQVFVLDTSTPEGSACKDALIAGAGQLILNLR